MRLTLVLLLSTTVAAAQIKQQPSDTAQKQQPRADGTQVLKPSAASSATKLVQQNVKQEQDVELMLKPEAVRESERSKLWNQTAPALRAKLEPAIKQVLARASEPTKPGEKAVDLVLEARKATYAALGSTPGQDVESLVYLVLLQCAKSAQEDLKSIMANVKAIKEGRRCAEPRCRDTIAARPDISKRTADALKEKVDSLSEMGEMESLRLQMAMDRMSKMMTVLSNLLKKASDTSSSITQNLK